jgi:Outer membrane protein and related peptidoglycan-associated (lipo)proteins
MAKIFLKKAEGDDGEHWLTISDLMSGLMIVFLFIAVAFMRHTAMEKDKITNIAVAYQENQVAIFNALNIEFEKDLPIWNASIDNETLSFQFNSPEVLFNAGDSEINGKFKSILSDFIPRYLNVLEQYKSSIDEVRIEGHTSTEWGRGTQRDDAYFLNMELSQGRTRSVLRYAYGLPLIPVEQKNWIKSNFAAVGFSSSKAILGIDGSEDMDRSRRVTFRVITNADIQIRKIVTGL